MMLDTPSGLAGLFILGYAMTYTQLLATSTLLLAAFLTQAQGDVT
ncbi:hypothetical protein SAMN04490207_0390 [Pseudomonas gessardii]|jgi:hypothetical protein|nr:hypothetical protein SAMN04490207_0390 [Pseudomonas gessardii]